jgi:phosphopantothenoylcysteine decarboxylase/phosphopantothenate--cysteine ligase
MSSVLAGKNILVGISGAIAAYKSAHVVRLLCRREACVEVVMTQHATEFVAPLTFETLSGKRVLVRMFPSESPGEPDHIRAVRHADAVLVAPATANLLAKAAHGLADDLLSTVLMAARCPIVFAPCMHENMYLNAAVQSNIQLLKDRGRHVVGPAEGALASGDSGIGRMVEPPEIVKALERILGAAPR